MPQNQEFHLLDEFEIAGNGKLADRRKVPSFFFKRVKGAKTPTFEEGLSIPPTLEVVTLEAKESASS